MPPSDHCLQKHANAVSSNLVFLVKITICQLGGMFEKENKMVVVIITSSIYCNIPDCVSKQQALVAPALCHTHQQRSAVQTRQVLSQTFINLVKRYHVFIYIYIDYLW